MLLENAVDQELGCMYQRLWTRDLFPDEHGARFRNPVAATRCVEVRGAGTACTASSYPADGKVVRFRRVLDTWGSPGLGRARGRTWSAWTGDRVLEDHDVRVPVDDDHRDHACFGSEGTLGTTVTLDAVLRAVRAPVVERIRDRCADHGSGCRVSWWNGCCRADQWELRNRTRWHDPNGLDTDDDVAGRIWIRLRFVLGLGLVDRLDCAGWVACW